jgi:SNF2 family DNA or RNA helicase
MARLIADRVGNRVHLESPFAYKDRAKGIIGARWSKDARRWTYPLDMETCRRLRDEFGDELVIGPELWEWAVEAKAKEESATGLLNLKDVDLMSEVDLDRVPQVAPTMWAAMQNRPYQPVATKYMSTMLRCLNADQPGIGKTIETIGALVERDVTGPILVLAPKTSCLTVWPVEIERWLADDVPYTIHNLTGLTPAKRDEMWDGFTAARRMSLMTGNPAMHFLIANAEQVGIRKFTVCPAGICDGDEDWCPEFAQHRNKSEQRRPFLHSIEWNAIIADETHKWLINTRGKSASQVGYGFTKLRVTEDAPMYALSGTPLKGKKVNIFGTLNWLWPKTYTSKWRFAESYFEVVKETIDAGRKGEIETKKIMDAWKSDKDKEAFFRAMSTVMIRRTKTELRKVNPAWMPPDKIYHDVYIPMEGKQKSHYTAMAKNSKVMLDGVQLSATGVLAEMTRLKQFAASDGTMEAGVFRPILPSNKFSWIVQFLEERGIEANGELSDDVQKVVVASQFTRILNLWSEALSEKGIANVMITGETKDRDRALNMKAFQEDDKVRVCLINTNAGGVSITLDAADDIVIADETWVPDEQEQVEDRVHRASNVEHQVDVWYLRTKGTIEEEIAQANASKAENNHVVLDSQRGIAFAAERFGTIIKGK